VALFFLAFLPQFVDPGRGPVWTQVLVLGAILGTLGFAMDCLYAVLAAAAAGRLRGRGTGKITGAVYLTLGAAAALTGGRH
jgi:threonine/homoserine/homoserine lactone efflux protein